MRLLIGCNERGQVAILEGSHYSDDVVTVAVSIADDAFNMMVATLKPREKHTLCCRLGLMGYEKRSQYEFAKVVGVCRERIRQLESRALRKLLLHPDILEIELRT